MTVALRSTDICKEAEIDKAFYVEHGQALTFTQVLLIYCL